MNEIPRDNLGINPVKNNAIGFGNKQVKKSEPTQKNTGNKNVDSLGNNPAEYIGRSQVKFNKLSFSGDIANNLRKDMEFYNNNSDLVQRSDKLHDIAYNNAMVKGDPNPYITATQVQMGYVNEMNKE